MGEGGLLGGEDGLFLDFSEGFTSVNELFFEGTGVFIGAGEGSIKELILGEEYLFLGFVS